jgi:hypothetical protein
VNIPCSKGYIVDDFLIDFDLMIFLPKINFVNNFSPLILTKNTSLN